MRKNREKKHKLQQIHRSHRVHVTGLILVGTLSLLALLIFGTVYVHSSLVASSKSILFSLEINDGTTTPVASSSSGSGAGLGSSSTSPQQEETRSPIASPPARTTESAVNFDFYLDIPGVDIAENEIRSSDTKQQRVMPNITIRRPTFRGRVNHAFAIILAEIHSSPVYTSTIQADGNGDWELTPSDDLSIGAHYVVFKIFDADAEVLLGQTVLHFVIVEENELTEETEQTATVPVPTVEPPSFYDSGRLSSDIQLEIPESYQDINPGEDLLTEITIISTDTSEFDQPTTLEYRIRNESGQIVLQQREQISLESRAAQSYIRLFKTGYRLSPGKYNLEVLMPYASGEIVAFSNADFSVQGEPVVVLGSAKVNVNLVLQALVLLLTVFGLITYYEFKQVEQLRKLIHQVTERDLLKKGLIH